MSRKMKTNGKKFAIRTAIFLAATMALNSGFASYAAVTR